MVRGELGDPRVRTEVVFVLPTVGLPAGTVPTAPDGLVQGLRAQGLEPSVTLLTDPDPQAARHRLADLLAPAVNVSGPPPAGPPPAEPAPAELPPVAVLSGRLVLHSTPLGAVLDDPRVLTGALCLDLPSGPDDLAGAVRRQLLGVVRIAGADRAAAAAVLRADPDPAVQEGDLLLDLVRGLERAGVPVRPVPLGTGYAWADPVGVDQIATASAASAAVDERTVRLREAARGGDGFYSTFMLRKVSWRFTAVAERLGLTPNQVTLLSFGLGLLAAGMLAIGDRPGSVAGALLLQFCLVVDCVDGELARYRRRFSRFGAWLDATTDRVKEFAAIGALALAAGGAGAWWLVAAAIGVQTFRNLLDLGWSLQRGAGPPPAATDWVRPQSWCRPPVPAPAGPGMLSWARRVGHFPIGERFLLISLGAAFWTPRGTLVALLVVGLLSAGYMLAAFAVRSRPGAADRGRIARLIDAGPVFGAILQRVIGAGAGRLAAIAPALVAVSELALIQWLSIEVAGASAGAATALVAVTAIAHYQHAYGVRENAAPAGAGAAGFVIGTDLRLIALCLVAVVPALVISGTEGGDWATSAVWALTVLVALSSTARSLQTWLTPPDPRPGPGDPGRPGEPEETSMYSTVPVDDGPETGVRAVANRITPGTTIAAAR